MRIRDEEEKLAVLAGIAVGVVIFAGIGVVVAKHFRSNTPEAILYTALAEDEAKEGVLHEESVAGAAAKFSGDSYSDEDGATKFEGKVECEASSPVSDVSMDLTIRQIQEDTYMKYDRLILASGNAEDDAAIKEYLDPLTNKWIIISDYDAQVRGYKEKGVWFGLLGAFSKKNTQEQIVELLKKHKVITILSSASTTHNGKAAIEYDLEVRRSAYEKFMEEVHASFPYKDDVLDMLFGEKTEEVTLIVDKKTKTVVKTSYAMPNICSDFVATFDEEAAYDMATTIRIEGAEAKDNKVKNITKPEAAITQEEFDIMLYGEVTEE